MRSSGSWWWNGLEALEKAGVVTAVMFVLMLLLYFSNWLPHYIGFMDSVCIACIVGIVSWPIFGLMDKIDDWGLVGYGSSFEEQCRRREEKRGYLDRQGELDHEAGKKLLAIHEASDKDFEARMKKQLDKPAVTVKEVVKVVREEPRVKRALEDMSDPKKRKRRRRRKTA